jgi:hypothetical protein
LFFLFDYNANVYWATLISTEAIQRFLKVVYRCAESSPLIFAQKRQQLFHFDDTPLRTPEQLFIMIRVSVWVFDQGHDAQSEFQLGMNKTQELLICFGPKLGPLDRLRPWRRAHSAKSLAHDKGLKGI